MINDEVANNRKKQNFRALPWFAFNLRPYFTSAVHVIILDIVMHYGERGRVPITIKLQ
jgi:hypothetical protein